MFLIRDLLYDRQNIMSIIHFSFKTTYNLFLNMRRMES